MSDKFYYRLVEVLPTKQEECNYEFYVIGYTYEFMGFHKHPCYPEHEYADPFISTLAKAYYDACPKILCAKGLENTVFILDGIKFERAGAVKNMLDILKHLMRLVDYRHFYPTQILFTKISSYNDEDVYEGFYSAYISRKRSEMRGFKAPEYHEFEKNNANARIRIERFMNCLIKYK